MEAWIRRFRADTTPLDRDRNRVRAHRYERRGQDTTRFFIRLPDLEKQIEVVERLLADLYLILHNGRFSTQMTFACDPVGTAQSLADLLVHGTINQATLAYGVVPSEPSDSDTVFWYWAKRDAMMPRKIAKRDAHRVLGEPHNRELQTDGASRRR